MRLVVETDPGVVELNWVWLPTWLGQNPTFKKNVEAHINKWLQEHGVVTTTPENLDLMHAEVLRFILDTFPSPLGLGDFLEGLKFVDGLGQEER